MRLFICGSYADASDRAVFSVAVNIRKRIFEKISSTKENPFHYFERLTGRSEYKLRAGNYRIISQIDEKTKQISVLFVDHRKNVYKKL
jgi:mRNA interferase RelE/StbE